MGCRGAEEQDLGDRTLGWPWECLRSLVKARKSWECSLRGRRLIFPWGARMTSLGQGCHLETQFHGAKRCFPSSPHDCREVECGPPPTSSLQGCLSHSAMLQLPCHESQQESRGKFPSSCRQAGSRPALPGRPSVNHHAQWASHCIIITILQARHKIIGLVRGEHLGNAFNKTNLVKA